MRIEDFASIAAIAALVGCVDAPAESSHDSAIVHAGPDVVTDGVVALGFGTEPHCSGALISPHVVVTAAHCIPDSVDGFVALAGWDLAQPTVSIAVHVAVAHPDYDGRDNDIGLVALLDPMPVPVLQLAVAPPAAGDVVTVVGFGRDDNGHAGAKRSGAAQVTGVTAQTLSLAADPALPCDGDSGGPTLDASSHVVGVHALSDCVDLAVDVRPDAYAADFVEPFIAEAETHQVCIGGVCDGAITGDCSAGGPAGAAPLAIAALVLWFSKRRQSSPKEMS